MNLVNRYYLSVALLILSMALFVSGGYIHAKAHLAQWLIASAWTQSTVKNMKAKPWPWADTWPVARLEVPEYNIDQYVLAGVTGESLAFGPGYMFASASPTERGNTVIAAHRDTHFKFLQNVQQGDEIKVHNTMGKQRTYSVQEVIIVDKENVAWLDNDSYSHQLSLVTCYPFNSIQAGGRLRYIVRAASTKELSF